MAVLAAFGGLAASSQAEDEDLPTVLTPPAAGDAVRAYKVLDQHCARCHQSGRLTRRPAEGNLGNILDLDALARRADLVRPGYPDASLLFTVMQTRHMPNDVTKDAGGNAEPSVEDVAAVRTWIAGLPAAPHCVWGVTEAENVNALIRADQQGADPETARFRRYVQLSHLGTSCGGQSRLDVYRQAVIKLLNSVSRASEPLRLDNVDVRGSFVAFDIRHLGWSPDEWEMLVKQRPDATRINLGSDVLESSGSQQPLVRADWLAHALSEPGNYYARLQLPVRESEFDASVGFTGNIGAPWIRMAGVAQSAVTGDARTILRRANSDGRVLWKAFDFEAKSEETSRTLSNLAARIARGTEDDVGVGAEQSRVLFQLPNGFLGAAVFSSDGTRRDEVKQTEPEGHASGLAGRSTGGLRCFVCHQPALLPFQDNLGGMVSAEARGSGLEINSLVSQAELDALVANDANVQTIIHRVVGIEPDLTIDGFEPIHALVLNYERALDIRRVAREMGRSVQQISQSLEKLDGDFAPAARRLRQGVITRAEFDWLAPELVEDLDRGRIVRAVDDDVLRLSLWSDKASYQVGDTAYFFASSTQDCHLTMISVDTNGLATVLFPNDFNPDNILRARQRLRVPGPADEFRFRLQTAGEEMIVGICMAGERKSPPGLSHDFERQRFTSLGDWEEFLRSELAADRKERAGGGTVQRTKLVSGRKRRDNVSSRADPSPLPQARAGIVIRID